MSDEQAVTATAASTNSIDLMAAGVLDDMSHRYRVKCSVGSEAAVSTGATTVTVALQDSADDSSFADTTLKSGAVAKASLVAGYLIFEGVLPRGTRRYVRGYYTVAVANLTAGKFNLQIEVD
jgi:hypothetical protein